MHFFYGNEDDSMHIIILSGGSGKRLWPLSTDNFPKQFIKIFNNGTQSMLQRTLNMLIDNIEYSSVNIVTTEDYIDLLQDQLNGLDVNIILEPEKRGTFGAIILSYSYLKDRFNLEGNDLICVLPIDGLYDLSFINSIRDVGKSMCSVSSLVTLIGIKPTHPSEKYGYIIPLDKSPYCDVLRFVEKPKIEVATQLISQYALWNSGVFIFNSIFLKDIAWKHNIVLDYVKLKEKYSFVSKGSFDKNVLEKSENIKVKMFVGEWKDIGTWSDLINLLDYRLNRDNTYLENCNNIKTINTTKKDILLIGVKNLVIINTDAGLLISHKDSVDEVKLHIDRI